MEKYVSPLRLKTSKRRISKDQLKFYYIKNNDGSPRWIWTAKSKQPKFLSFYHKGSLKAKLFSAVCNIIFLFKLQHVIFRKNKFFGTFKIASNLRDYRSDDIFIFTGTPGPKRKYSIYIQRKKKKDLYIKHAFEEDSIESIQNETKTLLLAGFLRLQSIVTPEIISEDEKYFCLEATKPSKHTNEFSKKHVRFINELYSFTSETFSPNEFLDVHAVHDRLEVLENTESWRIPKGFVKKLKLLLQNMQNEKIETAFAHGDFTPWNMFINSDDKLFLYDWEFAKNNMPKGFDIIHYIFQKGVLIDHKNWNQIKSDLSKVYSKFRFQSDMDIKQQLELYLLLNGIQQLEILAKHNQWHLQVEWLLNIWNDAISYCLKKSESQRSLVIIDIFNALFQRDYAGLKLPTMKPENISEFSDIDLCIPKKEVQYITMYLKRHPLVENIEITKKHSHTNLLINTISKEILSLDLIHKLKRKSLQFMDMKLVLKRSFMSNESIKKVSLLDTARYIGFFYGLNKSKVPEKYMPYEFLLNRSNKSVDTLLYCFYLTPEKNLKRIVKHVKMLEYNIGWNSTINKLEYLHDIIKGMIFKKGMVITFSGVDGAGKSTIIEHTKHILQKKYRKNVVVLRHRPSILPILSAYKYGKNKAESIAASGMPRQGNNKSTLSSLARFSYYYVDYLFGQFIIYFKYIRRGDIVLYDRYYFDFINDPKRSNIEIPQWLSKLGYKFLLKPKFNFFLYADANTIRERKKELDVSTILDLTYKYKTLFTDLGKKNQASFSMIKNIDLEESLQTITQKITLKN